MAETPCPILIVTASVNGRTGKVFEALGAGAFDAVSTPLSEGLGADALLSKIRTLHLLIGNSGSALGRVHPGNEEGTREPIILIGASAGGGWYCQTRRRELRCSCMRKSAIKRIFPVRRKFLSGGMRNA